MIAPVRLLARRCLRLPPTRASRHSLDTGADLRCRRVVQRLVKGRGRILAVAAPKPPECDAGLEQDERGGALGCVRSVASRSDRGWRFCSPYGFQSCSVADSRFRLTPSLTRPLSIDDATAWTVSAVVSRDGAESRSKGARTRSPMARVELIRTSSSRHVVEAGVVHVRSMPLRSRPLPVSGSGKSVSLLEQAKRTGL